MNQRGFFYAFLFLIFLAAVGFFSKSETIPVVEQQPAAAPVPVAAVPQVKKTVEIPLPTPRAAVQAIPTEKRRIATTDFREEEKDADPDLVAERNRQELRIRTLQMGSQ